MQQEPQQFAQQDQPQGAQEASFDQQPPMSQQMLESYQYLQSKSEINTKKQSESKKSSTQKSKAAPKKTKKGVSLAQTKGFSYPMQPANIGNAQMD